MYGMRIESSGLIIPNCSSVKAIMLTPAAGMFAIPMSASWTPFTVFSTPCPIPLKNSPAMVNPPQPHDDAEFEPLLLIAAKVVVMDVLPPRADSKAK